MSNQFNTVGSSLAEQVAVLLESGKTLAYSHRDYCGIGLGYLNGRYVYGEVYDGDLLTPEMAESSAATSPIEQKVFASRKEFVEWLAGQTDESLSGQEHAQEFMRGNQRITLDRLREFVTSGS